MAVTCSPRRHWNCRLLTQRTAAALLFFPFLVLPFPTSAADSGPEILGLRLDATSGQVRELLSKGGITIVEVDPETFTAPRPLQALEGVKVMRLMFEKEKLYKIVLLFELPPPERTAGKLIARYEKEKDRLKELLGPPVQDTVEMKAPDPAQRHEWITRGRGYYRCAWAVSGQMTVTLWLYGEDAGIVFMEVYERSESR